MVSHKDMQSQVQEYIIGYIYWIICVFQYVYIIHFIEKKKVQEGPELSKASS